MKLRFIDGYIFLMKNHNGPVKSKGYAQFFKIRLTDPF